MSDLQAPCCESPCFVVTNRRPVLDTYSGCGGCLHVRMTCDCGAVRNRFIDLRELWDEKRFSSETFVARETAELDRRIQRDSPDLPGHEEIVQILQDQKGDLSVYLDPEKE